MKLCHRIFLSLAVVGLAVLAGPLPTADAQVIAPVGPGRVQPRPPVPAFRPVTPNPVRPIAPQPGWNTGTVVRPGLPVRPGVAVRPDLTIRPGVVVRPNLAVRPGVVVRPNPVVRPGWAVNPYANYWLGLGTYGWPYAANWYVPVYNSGYYPGYVFRTPYTYLTNSTTIINVTNPGFGGGFDMMVPTLPAGDPQSDLLQQTVFPIQ